MPHAEHTPEEILESCAKTLKAPATDWDRIYVKLRTSEIGQDFPPERFLRTPLNTVKWVLEELDDAQKAKANLDAVTTAQLAQIVLLVAHGFSGSKQSAPKIQVKDFLPFPSWQPNRSASDGPSDPTKFVLSELFRERRIEPRIFAALIRGI